MLSKKIAESLDMEIPDSDDEEVSGELVVVEPHELPNVGNPELPDMGDIDHSMAEGEKQLEVLIRHGLGQVERLRDGHLDVDPKYRNRYLETVNQTIGVTLDAIKHKTDLQLKKKDLRMKEDSHRKPDSAGGSGGRQDNFFSGSREDLLKALDGEYVEVQEEDENS